MLHFLYSLCFRIALPFVLLRLWWSGRSKPEAWDRWQERLGFVARSPEPVIWVHAVSVGETIAAAPLVRGLLRRHPGIPIVMTAMTATGSARARAIFGDQVRYAYSPYDTPGSVRRFVRRLRPRVLVIMETELWPNMVSISHHSGVPIFLINARLSERSARGYQRVRSLARPLLASISWIAAQAEEDAGRFLRIGAREDTVTVTGSIKFDVDISDELRQAARNVRGDLGAARPVWIAASTHIGEDLQILNAHAAVLEQFPDSLLVLVPRHPERFEQVAGMVAEQGFTLARRSRQQQSERIGQSQVYLGDTMGELLMLYGAADVAFVGGSLIERGGHNPLEPAAWGMPVVSGPHIFNFETIYRQLGEGGGVTLVASSTALARVVTDLFRDRSAAGTLGNNALAVVNANRGALERVIDGISARV